MNGKGGMSLLRFNEFLLRRKKESLSPGGDCQKQERVKSSGWKNRLICLSSKKEKLFVSFAERRRGAEIRRDLVRWELVFVRLKRAKDQ